ncbi:MAG: RICIN domain-containing protein [Oscillospiraceae bacterium]|nr:RICIN domain-containing protein [Oscillospiraceae bacterium]
MKRLLFVLTLSLALLVAVTSFGADVSVMLNGEVIITRDANGVEVAPFIQDAATYVPVRAIANALNILIDWDNDTRTVFIGERGESAPELGENVNIYISGAKFNPTDAQGKAVYPIIKDGTTYLPIRAIAQAFAKKVDWDGESSVVLISDTARIDTTKTYKIVQSGTDSAIMTKDGSNDLEVRVFGGEVKAIWRFAPVEGEDGFYNIINTESGRAMDVNGGSRNPGAKLIQYGLGTGDNQKFMLVQSGDGSYKIFSKNSLLPFENSAGVVKQNIERESPAQNWEIIEAEATAQAEEAVYSTLVLEDGRALTYSADSTKLTAAPLSGEDDQKWSLVPNAGGFYYVQTKEGMRSIDVANNSKTDGDPLITYDHSGDDNQCWIFEKQEDGGYKIKSVHSELYIKALPDGSIVHSADGDVFGIY